MEHSSRLLIDACQIHGVDPAGLVLHSDNGGPMKGSTMLATLHKLGVVPSFSRPRVNDGNPYSEALFRTKVQARVSVKAVSKPGMRPAMGGFLCIVV
jgi:transposase InsO family protein